MLTVLKRIIIAGWKNFSQNIGLSIATVFILTLTVSLATSLFMIENAAHFLLSDLQEKVDVSVYFKEDCPEEDILAIKQDLESIPEVKKVEYISKDQALEDFKERHKEDTVIVASLEELGTNPFLATLNVKSWQASQYNAVANLLESSQFKDLLEKVDYFQKKPIIEKISSFSDQVNQTGIIVAAIISLIAGLVVFNQVRLSIYNSKKEIEIQRLVGASNSFIRGPFIIQAVIAGIFAVIISIIIFSIGLFLLNHKIENFIPGLSLSNYFFSNILFIFLVQLAIVIGLAVLSSLIAMRKYLKV